MKNSFLKKRRFNMSGVYEDSADDNDNEVTKKIKNKEFKVFL